MQAEKLSISLPADMARMVRRQVENGAYASNSEVIRDALRVWQDRAHEREERLEAIRAKIDEALQSAEWITDDDLNRYFERRLAKVRNKPK